MWEQMSETTTPPLLLEAGKLGAPALRCMARSCHSHSRPRSHQARGPSSLARRGLASATATTAASPVNGISKNE